jgi:hypothetical protein
LANPAKFKSLTDISKAAYIFMDQYERPGVLRWKERNTHAYAAYKLYTGKDYIDVVSTLYPGPDKAKQDYENGMSSPANIIEASPDFKDIIPLKISGVSKVSALGFADGGFTGPITTPVGYKKPGVPYSKSGIPIGNPFGQYWGELSRFIGPRRPGMDIWGGTEIPGLKFTGKIPQMSDYWHQMQEQPRKPFRGPGMGIDKDPMRYAGSGASMGFSGNGAYGIGPLLFADGGSAERSIKDWRKYPLSMLGFMGKASKTINPVLDKLIYGDFIRRYSKVWSGTAGKTDFANLAIAAIPFGSPAKTAATGAKSISPLVAQMMAQGANWSSEGRAFQMAAIDKEAAENLFKIDLSKINLPDNLPSVNISTAKKAIQDRVSGIVKGGIETFNSTDWEIVQALRVMELAKKFPKADLSDVKTFNELYGKEFYGLTGDPLIKLFKGVRSLDSASSVSKGWRTHGGLPTYFSTNPYIAATYSMMLGKRTAENLPMFAANLPMSKLPGYFGEGAVRGSQAQGSMEFPMSLPNNIMSEIASSIKEYSLPGSIMGNWLNVIKDGSLGLKDFWPRFHDWNGTVPGPYGQEVGAILKAGTEGVYQSSYINSLRNGTMNPTTSNSKVINVGSVKMEFTEPVTNGRQVFEEFKSLINFENSKAGPSINIGRGA